MVISPHGIEKYHINYSNNTQDTLEVFQSDFIRYETRLKSNWIMYVYEFQHSGGSNPAMTQALSGSLPWSNYTKNFEDDKQISDSNYHWKHNPAPGKMRVNIRAYWKEKDTLSSTLLLPTIDNLSNNTITDFDIPEIDQTTNLNFFGYQYANSTKIDYGWNLWNGKVRNMMIFDRFLTPSQLKNIFDKGITEFYDWAEFGEYEIIKQINKNSYLGSVYAYNTHNLNIEGNILTQNTNNLDGVIFR